MFNIVPLILILLSLTVIIVIIGRKFSILANLDIESIPAEREAKVKERIMSNRLKRNYFRYQTKFLRLFIPLFKGIGSIVKTSYSKLTDFKDSYKNELRVEEKLEPISEIETLFSEIEEFLKNEEIAQAEERYIKIISLDSQNIKAFRGLADLYFEQKNYQEAAQTAEHAVRLLEKSYESLIRQSEGSDQELRQSEMEKTNKQLSEVFYDISTYNLALEKYDLSIENINKALAIEPNNPRFLDTKLDLSIIIKDKSEAEKTLDKLAKVNPENNKLEELRKKVEEMEEGDS